MSKWAPEASQGRAEAPAYWWANLSQVTAAPLPASYLSFSEDLQNTFEEQKFITTLDTKNYRINPIWHYTEHTISNPPVSVSDYCFPVPLSHRGMTLPPLVLLTPSSVPQVSALLLSQSPQKMSNSGQLFQTFTYLEVCFNFNPEGRLLCLNTCLVLPSKWLDLQT